MHVPVATVQPCSFPPKISAFRVSLNFFSGSYAAHPIAKPSALDALPPSCLHCALSTVPALVPLDSSASSQENVISTSTLRSGASCVPCIAAAPFAAERDSVGTRDSCRQELRTAAPVSHSYRGPQGSDGRVALCEPARQSESPASTSSARPLDSRSPYLERWFK